MFHDTRESLCVREVSMFRDVGESVCAVWLCAFLEGMGAHVRVERLKAERVRKSLLATMAGYWKVGGFCLDDLVDDDKLVVYTRLVL